MHEFALAQNIVETIKDQVNKDLSKVVAINIDVGHFSGVMTDSLEFGLSVILTENDLPQVKININKIPTLAKCKCGKEYEIKEIFENCEFCQSFNRKIISGMDIVINSIELKDEWNIMNYDWVRRIN